MSAMELVWFGIVPAVALIGIIVGVGLGWNRATWRDWVRDMGGVFVLQLLYAGILVLMLAIYANDPTKLPVPKTVFGVPIGVPWFGAFGAVMVSLSALRDNRNNWDPKWWYWHASRPLVGAITGTFAVLVIVAGIVAVQVSTSSGPLPQASKYVYYAIAFVIGYREASFRELLKEVADLLLKPGQTGQTSVTGTYPPQGSEGTEVSIFGTVLSKVNSVTFDGTKAVIKSSTDTKLLVSAPQHAAGPTQIVVSTVDATFGNFPFTYT